MEQISLRELKQQAGPVGMQAVVHAQLEKCRRKITKTGNPFYEVGFADAEESLVLRVWNNTPMFTFCSELKERQFYEVTGEFSLGNDGRSVDGKNWTVRALSEAESAQVLSGSAELRQKQEADFVFIETTTGAIRDPRLKALCTSFLERFGERMQRTGAARDYHHARRGGLVEHVAQMMRTAVQVCEAYPMLNRDLLVSGVLFHDVGKLWENAYTADGFTMPFTEISELIGHIPLGMEIVNKLWRDLTENEAQTKEWSMLEPPSERVRLHLLHLIVSHHGELEFGSPVVPKTPEAQALHYIDNLDAKMEMFDRGYQVAGELARNVQERVRPLPGRLVKPLERFDFAESAPLPVPEEAPVVEEVEMIEPESAGPAESGDERDEPF